MVSVWKLHFDALPEDVQVEIKKLPDLLEYLGLISDAGNPMSLSVAYNSGHFFDPKFREIHLPLLVVLLPYLSWNNIWSIFLSPVQGNYTNFREIILEHFLQRNIDLTAKELKLIGSKPNSAYIVVPMVLAKLTEGNLEELESELPCENEISLIGFELKEERAIRDAKAWAETCTLFYKFIH